MNYIRLADANLTDWNHRTTVSIKTSISGMEQAPNTNGFPEDESGTGS